MTLRHELRRVLGGRRAQEDCSSSIGEELKMVTKSERGGRLSRDSAEILVGERPGEFMVVTEEGSAIPVAVRSGLTGAGAQPQPQQQPQLRGGAATGNAQALAQQLPQHASPFQRASAAASEEGAAQQLPGEAAAASQNGGSAAGGEDAVASAARRAHQQQEAGPSREGTPPRSWWGSVTSALGLKGGGGGGGHEGSAPVMGVKDSAMQTGAAAAALAEGAAAAPAGAAEEGAGAAREPGQAAAAPGPEAAAAAGNGQAPSPVSAFAAEVAVKPVSPWSAQGSGAEAGECPCTLFMGMRLAASPMLAAASVPEKIDGLMARVNCPFRHPARAGPGRCGAGCRERPRG